MFRWIGRASLSLMGGAVLLGTAWWAARDYQREQRIAQLEEEKAELVRVVSRLTNERRVGRLFVADQQVGSDGQVRESTVKFMSLGRNGRQGLVRQFNIPGDVCYIDALVVRFLDSYVEKGDKLRGHTLHLFRRAFGEGQPPATGYPLDTPGAVPADYQVDSEAGRFERQLWKRFWEYAADPSLAAGYGVRVAQGEAAYQRLRTGQLWEVSSRADGGLEMSPVPLDPLIRNQFGTQVSSR